MQEDLKKQLASLANGELSDQEREALGGLLREHPEAEELLRKFHADSERLQALPARKLPQDFADLVLAEIRARGLNIAPTPRRQAWWPAAAAAAAIIAVGLTTYALLQDFVNPARPPVVQNPAENKGNQQPPDNRVGDLKPTPEPIVTPPNPDVKTALEQLQKQLPTERELRNYGARMKQLIEPVRTDLAKALRSNSEQLVSAFDLRGESTPESVPFTKVEVFTVPFNPAAQNPFKTIDVRLPLFLDAKDLDTTKLVNRLKEDNLHHIDLSCNEGRKSLERFKTACKTAKVNLIVDPEVTKQLAVKPTGGSPRGPLVMVYLENVIPDQVAKLMQALQDEEKKAKGDAQFESIMIQALDEEGRKQLADSLGVSKDTLAPPKHRGSPLGVDSGKPLSEDTLKALEKLAAGNKPTAAKPGEPTAVIMFYYPNRSRMPVSKEVKTFLDNRTGWQADAVHVVFLLRPSRS